MRIWVDADACPAVIKEILYRAAERNQIHLALVANKALHTPRSPWIQLVQVGRGFDVAARYRFAALFQDVDDIEGGAAGKPDKQHLHRPDAEIAAARFRRDVRGGPRRSAPHATAPPRTVTEAVGIPVGGVP
jgi:hypothetical protein